MEAGPPVLGLSSAVMEAGPPVLGLSSAVREAGPPVLGLSCAVREAGPLIRYLPSLLIQFLCTVCTDELDQYTREIPYDVARPLWNIR